MIDILLFGMNVALLATFGWYVHESNKEKAKLVNALLSKSPQDMVNMTLADQTEIKPQVGPDKDPDLIPMDQLTDEEFDNHIAQELMN